jgi:hypothetical protein
MKSEVCVQMRLKALVAALALWTMPLAARAATCVSQAELTSADRASLGAASSRLLAAVFAQDTASLQTALLPAEAGSWESIKSAVEQSADLLKNGQPKLRNLYLLDASTQTETADTQFYCSNAAGSLTVTINMPSLPPGRYAVVLADAMDAPLAGQIGLILAQEGNGWKLAGLSLRQGAFHARDGLWYWQHARALGSSDGWSAWFSYEAARYLLVPVDFLGSPNLDKLKQEQSQLTNGLQNAFPYKLPDGDRTWTIEAVILDASLREPDLAVLYTSTGVTDPAALRTEATAVLSAFLKSQPGLRENFHGLWAVASKNGKPSPILELPMNKIP